MQTILIGSFPQWRNSGGENARLKDEVRFYKGYADRFADTIQEQEEQNIRLRKILEFYADKKTYETNVTDQWEPVKPINQDLGAKARQELEGEN